MRRIRVARTALAEQLNMAAKAAAKEEDWPRAAPAIVTMCHEAEHLSQLLSELRQIEISLASKREQVRQSTQQCQELLKRVDYTTTMLYGPTSEKKRDFGIRPIERKSKKVVAQSTITRLRWRDSDTTCLEWEPIAGASYDVEWFADEYLHRKLGTAPCTEPCFDMAIVLHEGDLWTRVRARKGKTISDWSTPVYMEGCRSERLAA